MKNLISFFDRNYNLLFKKKSCVKLFFADEIFKYNDILFDGKRHMRCLGKQWYIYKKD